MTWSFDDKLPIYLQIIRILKSDLARGKYQPGEKLPAVRELALSAGVNPNTMQKALAELERDGLVARTVYAQIPPRVEYTATEKGLSLAPLLEAMCAWGSSTWTTASN